MSASNSAIESSSKRFRNSDYKSIFLSALIALSIALIIAFFTGQVSGSPILLLVKVLSSPCWGGG